MLELMRYVVKSVLTSLYNDLMRWFISPLIFTYCYCGPKQLTFHLTSAYCKFGGGDTWVTSMNITMDYAETATLDLSKEKNIGLPAPH